MGVRDWLRNGPPLITRPPGWAQAAAPPPARKQSLGGFEAAPIGYPNWSGLDVAPLAHGPGATALLTAPHGDGNSAVYACLAALAAAFVEAPPRVYRRAGPGQREERPDHPATRLLARPNPAMSWAEVGAWCQWAKHLEGNAYLRKVRAGNKLTGNVVELWPLSPTRVAVRRDSPTEFISAYRYTYAPGRWDDIPPANIVHLRLGLDDRDHTRGLAPLRRLVGEITTDAQAEAWAAAMLANGAIAGLVYSVAAELPDQAAADAIKARIQSLYGGANRGATAVLDNGGTLSTLGFSPEQMAFESVRRIPEERISAVLRVPAIVAGLGAGLARATYANYAEARDAFTEQTIGPLWMADAATLTAQLLPDFSSDAALEIAFDTSDVRALQPDVDAQYVRIDRAFASGWITLNEARADTGFPPVAGGDVRRVPVNVTEVAPGQPAPAAAAPPLAGPTPLPVAASGPPWATLARGSSVDPAVITPADLAAWRARARELSDEVPLLGALLTATPARNGNGVAH